MAPRFCKASQTWPAEKFSKWKMDGSCLTCSYTCSQQVKSQNRKSLFSYIFEKRLLHPSVSSFIHKEYFSQVSLQPLHTRQALELQLNRECSCLVADTSYTDQLPTSGKRLSSQIRWGKAKQFFQSLCKAANQRIFLPVQ